MKDQMQRDSRTIVDQNFLTKVTFHNDNIKVTGRLFDISNYGFCIAIKDLTEDVQINSEGILTLKKFGKTIEIPASVQWIDPVESYFRCMGLMTKINLLTTELKNYIK